MTLDASGNMGSVTFDAVGQTMTSVGANAIGTTMTSAGANAVANSRTRTLGSTVGVGGVALSATSGTFQTASTSNVGVPNLSVGITTTGRPIHVGLIADGGTASYFAALGPANVIPQANAYILRNGSIIAELQIATFFNSGGNTMIITVPITGISAIDFPVAGSYTYSIQLSTTNGSTTATISGAKLVAYEL